MIEPVEDWVPPEVDVDVPNAARMYDYFLGGGHNFGADRELAEHVMRLIPAEYFARCNRAFMGRAVTFLVEAGVRQFVDLGSGIPTVGNVHEIAHRVSPDCRVVYVDNDPVAVAHSRRLLEGTDGVTAVGADLRRPDAVVDHPVVRQMIDFSQPVAVMLCAVLHFIADCDDPAGIVAAYRDRMAEGSYIVISHATADDDFPELREAADVYRNTTTPATLRTRAEILRLFNGVTLIPPGLVWTPLWRPDAYDEADPRQSLAFGGVAIK